MKEQLFILWTNDNPVTSEKMVCMYSKNAMLKQWWGEVTIIMWGAPVQYVARDKSIQELLKQVQEAGVNVSACLSCSEELGVVNEINELGIELKYWGEPLTQILKSNQKLITV